MSAEMSKVRIGIADYSTMSSFDVAW
jgi:hypothetical protein